MRIGFIDRGDLTQITANRVSIIKNTAAARRLGHEVALIVPRYGMSTEVAGSRIEAALLRIAVRERFPISRLPRPLARGRGKRSFDLLAALWARLKSYDLVWSREIHAAYYASLCGLPTVLEHHHPFKPARLRLVRRLMERVAFRGVVAISETHKRSLIESGLPAKKILVAHSGVDLEHFGAGQAPEFNLRERWGLGRGPVVLYAGSLYSGRGGEQILQAAQRLQDVQFLLIGGRDFEIARLKESFGVNGKSNVRFAGPLAHADLPEILRAADVLVAPYTQECQDIGGKYTISYASPIKLFEYMAAGKPIVASNIGAIPEVIRHEENGLLVAPASAEELAAAVSRLLSDHPLAARLGATAQSDVRHYSWDERVSRVLEFACAGIPGTQSQLKSES